MIMNEFKKEVSKRIEEVPRNKALLAAANIFKTETILSKYSYYFSWLGRPVIQYPQDVVAMQELVLKIKPDLIIETGIAHGGSLFMSASMLALVNLCGGIESGSTIDPQKSKRKSVFNSRKAAP